MASHYRNVFLFFDDPLFFCDRMVVRNSRDETLMHEWGLSFRDNSGGGICNHARSAKIGYHIPIHIHRVVYS